MGAGAPNQALVECRTENECLDVYLKELIVPETVTAIDFSMYGSGQEYFETITVQPDNPKYRSYQGVLYTKDGSEMLYYPDGKYDAEITLLQNTSTIFADTLRGRLERINVPEGSIYYKSVDGVLYSADGTRMVIFPQAKPVEHYIVEDTVKEINLAHFNYCKDLKSIHINENIENINAASFDRQVSFFLRQR